MGWRPKSKQDGLEQARYFRRMRNRENPGDPNNRSDAVHDLSTAAVNVASALRNLLGTLSQTVEHQRLRQQDTDLNSGRLNAQSSDIKNKSD